MAINKKLIHFNSKENFDNKVANNEILDTSIVFVKDSKEIYTHGNLYKSVNWSVLTPQVAGDIAYWDGSKVKTVSQENWDSSLGTPVGVVVVPAGFAPDGKARMLSLRWADGSTTGSIEPELVKWSSVSENTSLLDYSYLPTTDNMGSTTTGYSSSIGNLPSDCGTGDTSYIDPDAKYFESNYMVPSPYLGDKSNPEYYADLLIFGKYYANALSDFDGMNNTNTLVNLRDVGTNTFYYAAGRANSYKVTGVEEIKWYLPAIGELAYMVVRFNKIQSALEKLNTSLLDDLGYYWSSTECHSHQAYSIGMSKGASIVKGDKTYNKYGIRPFAIID